MLLFFIILNYFTSIAQDPNEAFLVVDPQGHNALVNGIEYSPLTEELISISDDKTIRLWVLDDQILNRTFRVYTESSGPEGMLYASDISPDGRFLAVGGYSSLNDIKIIDIQTGEIDEILTKHVNVITDVEFSPDGNMLASSSADESIIIWTRPSPDSNFLPTHNLYQHQSRVNAIDFSPDGTKLVSVSDDETTRIWDVETFGEGDPVLLRSHLGPVKRVDGNSYGFLTGGEKGILNFWSWEGALQQQITQFDSPVVSIVCDDNSSKAFISANRQVVIDMRNPSRLQSVFSRNRNVSAALFMGDELFIGQGRSGNLISIKTDNLTPQYAMAGDGKDLRRLFIKGNKLGFNSDNSRVPDGYFDFDAEQIIRDKEEMIGFAGPKINDGPFEFTKPSSNQLVFGSNFNITNTRNDGRVISYCLLPNENIVVGSDRTLKVYDPNGNLLKTLPGHNGQVLSIVANEENFYTYGGDQIVKVWSAVSNELKYNLFITKKYEWIIWDDNGNYSASAGGEKYLNWQLEGKKEELAKFFDVSTYAAQFKKESLEDLEGARDMVIDLPDQPQVLWNDPEEYQISSNSDQFRIKATIASNEPVEKVRILVEGKALPKKRGVTDVKQVDEIISLTSYKTVIQIFASTENSKIISEKRVIINPNFKGSSNTGVSIIDVNNKPDLYFVGIGVSEFQNSEWNLTFADDDANSIYEIFAAKESPIYDEFDGVNLINAEATRDNIINTLNSLAEKVKPKDQVILFVASHGINQDGFYYVLTHDANKSDLKNTCLQWNDIADVLSNLPCRVLMFLDTCHSGALGSSLVSSSKFIKNTEALREMGSNEVGVVIMSGSTGEESSLESEEWAHGAFTLSLIEGLKEKKADLKNDGLIYLRELDLFVSDNVYELTSGKQNPTTQKPSSISKLIIY